MRPCPLDEGAERAHGVLAVPEYEAVTTLHISRQAPQVTTFQDVLSFDPMAWQDFYPTQFKIIQSRSVTRLAAERMDLMNRPELLERKGSPIGRAIGTLRSWLPGRKAPSGEPGDPLDQPTHAVVVTNRGSR